MTFKTIEFDHGGELQIPNEDTTDREPVKALVYTVDYAPVSYADFMLPTENRVNGDEYTIKNLNGAQRDPAVDAPFASVSQGWGVNFEPGDGALYSPLNRLALWSKNDTITVVWSDASNLTGWFVTGRSGINSPWAYDRG